MTDASRSAQVRLIDASPDAPGLDIYGGSEGLAYGLGFGTATSYIALPPATYRLSTRAAGTAQVLTRASSSLAAGRQYTLLIEGNNAGLQGKLLDDAPPILGVGESAIRLVSAATRPGAMDVYLVPPGERSSAAHPVLAAAGFGTNSGYMSVPAGVYALVAVPTGTPLTAAAHVLYSGPQLAFDPGSARTAVLIDGGPHTGSALSVILAEDGEAASR